MMQAQTVQEQIDVTKSFLTTTYQEQKVLQEAADQVKKQLAWLQTFMGALLVWAILGFAGFVMSLVCLNRSGSTTQHVIGVLLAIFLGPFYWIYFAFAGDYCVKYT